MARSARAAAPHSTSRTCAISPPSMKSPSSGTGHARAQRLELCVDAARVLATWREGDVRCLPIQEAAPRRRRAVETAQQLMLLPLLHTHTLQRATALRELPDAQWHSHPRAKHGTGSVHFCQPAAPHGLRLLQRPPRLLRHRDQLRRRHDAVHELVVRLARDALHQLAVEREPNCSGSAKVSTRSSPLDRARGGPTTAVAPRSGSRHPFTCASCLQACMKVS